jgi:hypothetical protein
MSVEHSGRAPDTNRIASRAIADRTRLRFAIGLSAALALGACESKPSPSSIASSAASTSTTSGPAATSAASVPPSAAASAVSRDPMGPTAASSDPLAPAIELDARSPIRGEAMPAPPHRVRATASPKVAPDVFAKATNGVLPDAAADAVLAKGAASKVTLVDAGAEPREVLRYDLPAETKQSTTMRMTIGMKLGLDGRAPQAVQVPTMEVKLGLASGAKRDAAGNTSIDGRIEAVRVVPEGDAARAMAELVEGQLRALEGTRIRYAVSASGRASDVRVEAAPNAPEQATKVMGQMSQSFESMVAPLPDEAVGVGGRWVVTNRISTGADVLQWTTYTLKSKTGTKIEIETEVAQLAARATMTGGDLPPGIVAKVRSFSSSGRGESVLDLARLVPIRGDGQLASSVTIVAGGATTMIDTSARVTFTEDR